MRRPKWAPRQYLHRGAAVPQVVASLYYAQLLRPSGYA